MNQTAPQGAPDIAVTSSQRDGRFSLRGIQCLRALAALMVVVYHGFEAGNQSLDKLHLDTGRVAWPNGSAGVDIFFVISGFVMMISSHQLSGWRDARHFVTQRLIRVVPLYWFFSAVKILAISLAPPLAVRTQLAFFYVVASFLFLPLHDQMGAFKPLLPIGWTLTFEMMFYGLFAIGLIARGSVEFIVFPILLILALVPHSSEPAIFELFNPIVIEFALGMIVGRLFLRGLRIPTYGAWPVLVISLYVLFFIIPSEPRTRALYWGGPACLIVASVVSLEHQIRSMLPRLLQKMGDASYAIYLSHGFIIPVLALGFYRLPHQFLSTTAWIVIVLVTSSATGYAVHMILERPLMAWLRSRSQARMKKSTAPGALPGHG